MLNKKIEHKSSKLLMTAATLTPMFATALPQVTNSPVVQSIVANADATSEAPNQANGISKDGKTKDVTYDTHTKNSANVNDNGVGEGATSQTDRFSPVNTANSLAGVTSDSNSTNNNSATSGTSSNASSQASSQNTTNNFGSTSASASNSNNSNKTNTNNSSQQNNNQSKATQNDADTQQIINYINQHAEETAHIASDAKLITHFPAGVNKATQLVSHGFEQYMLSVKYNGMHHSVAVFYNPQTKEFCAIESGNEQTLLSKSDLLRLFGLQSKDGKTNNATNGNATNGTTGGGSSIGLPSGAGVGGLSTSDGLAQTNTQTGNNKIALSALGLSAIGLSLGLAGDKLKIRG